MPSLYRTASWPARLPTTIEYVSALSLRPPHAGRPELEVVPAKLLGDVPAPAIAVGHGLHQMRSGRHETFPGIAKRDAPLALIDLCRWEARAHRDMEVEIALEMFGEHKPCLLYTSDAADE